MEKASLEVQGPPWDVVPLRKEGTCARLSSFRALDGKTYRPPLVVADPRKIWLSPAYLGPKPMGAQYINLHFA
ncbi:hypothetical protein TNCV_863121 [Trichonephila clavipes]|nr:hypothetical protein TNCV_863121 [Trichonephila clavipes]